MFMATEKRTVLGLCFGSLFHIENFTIEGFTLRPRRPVQYSCTHCIKMDKTSWTLSIRQQGKGENDGGLTIYYRYTDRGGTGELKTGLGQGGIFIS